MQFNRKQKINMKLNKSFGIGLAIHIVSARLFFCHDLKLFSKNLRGEYFKPSCADPFLLQFYILVKVLYMHQKTFVLEIESMKDNTYIEETYNNQLTRNINELPSESSYSMIASS